MKRQPTVDLIPEFETYFNSKFASAPTKVQNRISTPERMTLYMFARWLDKRNKRKVTKRTA